MKTVTTSIPLLRTRQTMLVMSSIALVSSILAHLVLQFHWRNAFALFELPAIFIAPIYVVLGMIEAVRYQRAWQIVVSVGLSATACAVVYITIYAFFKGLYA
jgi:hypothetical protein